MTLAVLVSGLRWLFWGLCYVVIVLFAAVAVASSGAPSWVRWGFVVAVVVALGADARMKARARA